MTFQMLNVNRHHAVKIIILLLRYSHCI